MSRLVSSSLKELNMQHAVHTRATIEVADTAEVSGRVTADEVNLDRFHNRIRKEESPMTQLRRGVVGVIAAFVVVSLSFSAQAAEKKKVMGTNKYGPEISSTVVPLGPGDDPKHRLTALCIRRDTTTSPDPYWNETTQIVYG